MTTNPKKALMQLEGIELDMCVALAAGFDPEIQENYLGKYIPAGPINGNSIFKPTTNWADTGPLIEQLLAKQQDYCSLEFWKDPKEINCSIQGEPINIDGCANTPLIAFCRAYVLANWNEAVEKYISGLPQCR